MASVKETTGFWPKMKLSMKCISVRDLLNFEKPRM